MKECTIEDYGRDELIYSETLPGGEQRWVTIFAELNLGRVHRSLSAGTLFPKHWDAPHQSVPITEAKRREIANRITEFFVANGITYELVQ